VNTADLFKKQFVFSFEVYPPKKTAPIEVVYRAIDDLSKLAPDYISVTYGAGGGAATATATVKIADYIKSTHDIEAVAHIPSINLTRDQASSLLARLQDRNIMNILALRGDRRPEDDTSTQQQPSEFRYASDLVSYIKQIEAANPPSKQFNIIGACYPEVHPEAKDAESDLANLETKVEAGTTQLLTQLFFDNAAYYRFLEKARTANINIPIQAGILPLISARQGAFIIKLCNPTVPAKLQAIFDKYADDDKSFRAAGIDYATTQIVDLIEQKVDGIHLYTMNNPETATTITKAVYPLLNRTSP